MKIPSREEFRQIMIERHTLPVFERLAQSRIAVAGLGGLGSNIAVSLVRAGIGELFLVDFDSVELSNLNRQQYEISDIGRPKTEALYERLMRINPYIKITYKTIRVNQDNAAELFGSFPVVCEAFDRADMKAMLINTLLSECPDTTIVSASGMAGYLSSNTITTRRVMSRLYVCGDGITDSESVNGLMAPRVAICANHQANAALRLCLGKTDI